MKKDHLRERIAMSIIGQVICGICIGMFKTVALGVDPFQTLMSGLNHIITIPFGTLYMIVNAILLVFSLIFDRTKIGIGTIFNLTAVGYITSFSQNIFSSVLLPMTLWQKGLFLIVAVVFLCFGCAMCMNGDLGVSAYDAVAMIISEHYTKLPFKYWRIITDLFCVCAGAVLCLIAQVSWQGIGEIIGIGTLITAFFMGPLISFFRSRLPLSEQNKKGKQ